MSDVKVWKLKGFLPGVEGECKAVFQPEVVLALDYDALQLRFNSVSEALSYLMERFDNEVCVCDHCGDEKPMRDSDSAIYLRDFFARSAPVEREQGIPGTSFQALNAKANAGDL